jgi:ABC-2 type transport system ATP-binding protein
MEEAERLCDRIVIIDHGRVIASDTVRGLYGLLPASRRLAVQLRDAPTDGVLDQLRAMAAVESIEVVGARGDLETVFLALTGRTLRD